MFFSHRAAPPEPVGSDCAGSDRRPPLARAQFPAFLSLPREGFFSCRASRGSGSGSARLPAAPVLLGFRRRISALPSALLISTNATKPLSFCCVRRGSKNKGLGRTQDKIMVLLSFAEPLFVAPLPCHLILYAPYGPIISDILRHVKHHGAPRDA